jgi:hypothetical protein
LGREFPATQRRLSLGRGFRKPVQEEGVRFFPWRRAVATKLRNTLWFSKPWTERVPKITRHMMTTGRRLRSAWWLVGGTEGYPTNSRWSRQGGKPKTGKKRENMPVHRRRLCLEWA